MEEKTMEFKEKVVAINRVAKVVKGGRNFRFSAVVVVGSVRPILELDGYKNIKTKVIGTNNPRNVGYATMNALENMATAENIAKKRGKKVEEIV